MENANRSFRSYLVFIASVAVTIEALVLAALLSLLAALQVTSGLQPGEIPLGALLIISFIVCWVFFAILFRIMRRIQTFIYVMAIPLAYVLVRYPLTLPQLILAVAAFIIFVILARYLRPSLLPIPAICAVSLSMGLSIFPFFRLFGISG